MMGHEPDSGVDNPYKTQTEKNTHTPWLADTMPVDVDLDGLAEYAKHMADASKDLASRQGHLQHLMSMPQDAWKGLTLGEATFVRSQMVANASEFTAYLAVLGQTLMNIGSAAQTVADIYSSTDGVSAASLNDVLFAFGDPKATRPDGLPKGIGQTYDQAVAEAAAKTGTPPSSALWQTPTERVISGIQTEQTSLGPNGERRVVTTTTPPGGPTIVTSVVYSADGKVLSSTTTRTSSSYDTATRTNTETVVSYSGDTQTGTSVKKTTTDASGNVSHETTTNFDGAGHTTGTRTEDVNQQTGEQTEVTTSVDGKGKSHETDHVTIGKATPGQETVEKPIDAEYQPALDTGN
jgi:uncharacterized protein YukE